jgi:hypothetical protein
VVSEVRVAVVVTPYRGDLEGASARLRNKIARVSDAHTTSGDSPITTRGGVVGRQGRYAEPERRGMYAVFIADGRSAEVTASGSTDDLAALGPELEAMVSTLTFGSGP